MTLAKLDIDTFRCDECQSVLYACDECGRWHMPGTGLCQNPRCPGKVMPVVPLHTGKRWDRQGTAPEWICPLTFDRQTGNITGSLITAEQWSFASVYAAAVANGALFVWAGDNIYCVDTNYRPVDADGNWTLGTGLVPARMPVEERISVVGEHVCLACQDGFFWCCSEELPELITPGKPITQVAGPMGWAGWINKDDLKCLFVATIPNATANPAVTQISLEQNAELNSAHVAMSYDALYWHGQDGWIWRCELVSRKVSRVQHFEYRVLALWTQAERVGCIAEHHGNLIVVPDILQHASIVAAQGTFHDIYVSDNKFAIICDRSLAVVDAVMHINPLPPIPLNGQHIAGLVAKLTGDGRELLFQLYREQSQTSLVALSLVSGAPILVWRSNNIQAQTIIPTRDRLYIIHDCGVIALKGVSA